MDTRENTRKIVIDFIEEIWNRRKFERLKLYLHPDFTDHSLPVSFPAGEEGLKKWIMLTGASFEHQTTIQQQVSEENQAMIKISMHLKHIGMWRNLEATGAEIIAVGYRFFQISDQRIMAHWGLVDGNAIENQISQKIKGCQIHL